MADFAIAFSLVRPFERGYVNDPDDDGGETIDGISRVHQPHWKGWTLIDAWKREQPAARPFLLSARQYALIDPLIVAFYRVEFWERLRGTDLASQAIADELLEASILLGRARGAAILRRALNMANDRATRWPDLPDGDAIDDAVIEAVRAAVRTRRDPYVVTLQNVLQGAHFVARFEARPVNEKFIGWLNRLTFEPKGRRA